ncbi:flavin-binding monooxygenase-like protein-like protein [Plenodomus tracheiphilus IPT5]|uniref:Flavin-binding monooxygenase-like protein-like protein n=1 Tax=Plenodomus tracheiphilus IPT5 TaxID=1408161 RepID=A0A6A7B7E9_9PLEO|nr:flavin-binding monooxygenase-like protein-like protein [Plenodomus tracheiphilus IPT5]
MEELDLVIVGAGIYGLTSASTYHRLHPSAKILILDAAPGIGGPWASHRIFPGLRTNNLWSMYEHPDFPMDKERFGVKRGEHVPAKNMLEYIEALAEWSGVRDFVRLNTKVELIEKKGEGWMLHCVRHADSEEPFEIQTKKLIIAVGTTNRPFMPQFPKSPDFTPLVVHSKDFPSHYEQIAKPGTHTIVVGSGKSAWDVAYACAIQQDSTVTILIRPSGNGPNWISPSHVTPFSLWLEKLVFTRFFGLVSPCPWAKTSGIEGWLRSFFHGTWLGRKVTAAFWNILGEDVIALNKLDEHPETKKLRPWRGGFEVGNCLSIHNYPTNFFDLVRNGRIKILFDEVSSLNPGNNINLKTGTTLHANAIVCATGWHISNTIPFHPQTLETELGLPSHQPPTPEEQTLIQNSESTLYERYPYLLTRNKTRIHHPNPNLRYSQQQQPTKQGLQPYRLHRFIVPLSTLHTRTLAFTGALHTLGTFPCAYIQSLWMTAYLDGSMPPPSATYEQLRAEVYRNSQYCVIRGPTGVGATMPDLVFDSLSYFDVLLGDLGVEGRRKGGVTEWVGGYGPGDYGGLVGEWETRQMENCKKLA